MPPRLTTRRKAGHSIWREDVEIFFIAASFALSHFSPPCLFVVVLGVFLDGQQGGSSNFEPM